MSLAGLDATIHEARDGIFRDIQSPLSRHGYHDERNEEPPVAAEGFSRTFARNASGRSFYDGSNNQTAGLRSINEAYTMRPEAGPGPEISPLIATEPRTARITLLRSNCAACGCPDSRQSKFRSPNLLNTVLGSLFVGYRVSPWSKEACDDVDCQQDLTTLTFAYIFPQWLLNRVFLTTMVYNSSKGPELCLQVMRVRPNDAEIFRLFRRVLPFRLDHMKRLLNSGEGSVLDVQQNNQTVLSVSRIKNREAFPYYSTRFTGRYPNKIVGCRGISGSPGG